MNPTSPEAVDETAGHLEENQELTTTTELTDPEAAANDETAEHLEENQELTTTTDAIEEEDDDNESIIEEDTEFDAEVDALGDQIDAVRAQIEILEDLEVELGAIQTGLEEQQQRLLQLHSNWNDTSTVLPDVQTNIQGLQEAFVTTFAKIQATGISFGEQQSLNSIEQILDTLDERLTELDEQEEKLKEELQAKLKDSYLEDPYETGLDPLFFGDDGTFSADSDEEDDEENEEELIAASAVVESTEAELALEHEEEKSADATEEQPDSKYRLAPDRPPKVGRKTVGFIGLHFLGEPRPSKNKLINIANRCRNAYANISGGEIVFETEAKVIDVNYRQEKKNLRNAERAAKKQMGSKDLYAICNYGTKNFSNGSGNTAHVMGLNTRDYYHELGHCRPWVWAHAGRYRMKVVGKGRHKRKVRVYEAYGDGTSFMGRFPCSVVNVAQAYDAGLLNGQIALHDRGDGEVIYPFRTLYSKHKEGYFQGVSIPGADFNSERDLFVGTATKNGETFFAFYLRNPGKGHSGSAMDGRFTQHGEYGGFDFDVVELPDNAGMGLKVKHKLVG